MFRKLEARAQSEPWNSGIGILFRQFEQNGSLWTANEITFSERTPGDMTQASIVLSHNEAQLLMDDLWNCGLRPSEGSGSAGALAATQHHLEDMRKMVFAAQAIPA